MYIILWKDKPKLNAEYDVSNWTALHSVFGTLEEAKEWEHSYDYEYGQLFEYKIAKLSFLD